MSSDTNWAHQLKPSSFSFTGDEKGIEVLSLFERNYKKMITFCCLPGESEAEKSWTLFRVGDATFECRLVPLQPLKKFTSARIRYWLSKNELFQEVDNYDLFPDVLRHKAKNEIFLVEVKFRELICHAEMKNA